MYLYFVLCIGFSTILLMAYLTKTTHCFLQYFIGILVSIIWGFVALTLLYDPTMNQEDFIDYALLNFEYCF